MLSRRAFLAAVPLTASALAAQDGGKRIGFVDDDLDNFHARVFLEAIRGPLKERGYTVAGATALQHEKSRAWAAKNNLPYFDDAAALDKAVDVYAILAPSTPDTHEKLCQAILPFGKTTFVDKTFAPDVATAQRIFDLADKHKVALQSSSSLRYTAAQKVAKPEEIRHVITWGPGRSYDEYAVHPVEMAVSLLGPEAVALTRRGKEPESQLLIDFSGGRTAVVNVYNQRKTPYAASITTAKESRYVEVDTKPLFVDAGAAMLDFFAAGKPLVDRRETMTVMKILEASRKPEALDRAITL